MYEVVPTDAPLSQGDIIDRCPIFRLELALNEGVDLDAGPVRYRVRVVVMTQSCDLAQVKTTRAVVAVMHPAQDLVANGILTASLIRDNVSRHRVFGWYFLPKADEPISMPESIVNFHELHTLSRAVLERLIAQGSRVCRIKIPFREHLAQQFAVTYMRIGLPEPYPTEP